MAIQRITCLQCGGNTFAKDEHNHLICTHCGSAFALKGNVCPACSTVNDAHQSLCVQCGRKLKRKCIACGHENNAAAEVCINCNNALDTLEFVSQRFREAQQDQATRRAGIVGDSKRGDAETMAAIRAESAERERQRLAHLTERNAAQASQERKLFLAAIVFGVVVLGSLLAIVVLSAIARGGGG